jgi:hypothetical protein
LDGRGIRKSKKRGVAALSVWGLSGNKPRPTGQTAVAVRDDGGVRGVITLGAFPVSCWSVDRKDLRILSDAFRHHDRTKKEAPEA